VESKKMKNTTRTFLLNCVFILTLTTLSACVTSQRMTPSAPQTAQQPSSAALPKVKVAILLPMSGQNKPLGDAMLNAAQMALFDVGYADFELIPRDTKGTPAGADEATRSAIAAGAQLILGPLFASEVRAAKPIAQGAGLNMISFSTDWTLAGGNTFIMGFLPFDQIERVSKFTAAQGIKRVGVIAPDNQYGRTVAQAFNTMAGRTGMNIAAQSVFAESGVNLIPVTNAFASAAKQPQAVLMPVGGKQAQAVAQALAANGLPASTVRRLGTGLLDDAALARDPNLNGAWFAAPSPTLRARFEERYQSTYGTTAPRLTTLAYDATALAAALAKRGVDAGGKPAFDRNEIANPNGFSGIDGVFRFRPSGTAERALAVLEFKNGQISVIDEAPKTFQALIQ
jgi:branched-chain amino acid transport system substrate-binding protein